MIEIKKVLVVGNIFDSPQIYTYATSFYKTFKSLGYEVEKFNYREKFFSVSKLNNFFINLFLLRKVALFESDLIFFIKAENISFKTIKILKTKFSSLIINFYPDNPFCFWNKNSNSNVLKSLPFYDCFLIWSKMLMPALESAGCKKVYYFPFAYDQDIYCCNDFEKEVAKNYIYDVCFAGTWELEREEWLTQLCQKLPDLNLGIWGNLWDEKLSDDSILRNYLQGKAVYSKELVKIFRQSKIVLNFIRKQNMTSHNMRTFEIPVTGSFMLTQRTLEQADFLFREGESIECFDDIQELINKVKFYLQNDELREKIEERGLEVARQFSLGNILQEFMSFLEKESLGDEFSTKRET